MQPTTILGKNRNAELAIYGPIGADMWGDGITADDVRQALKDLEGKAEKVTARIHSPGGNVFEAEAIYNALMRFPGEIVTTIDGVAASAASLVAMVGGRITMAENAWLMIHPPYAFTEGTADELRNTADLLEKMSDSMARLYSGRDGVSPETARAWMGTETWFNSAEALDAGLVDEITEQLSMAACIPVGAYRKTPEVLQCPRPKPSGKAFWRLKLAELALTLH